MSSGSDRTTRSLSWFLLLIGIVALVVVGFWVLLGHRYSSENFALAPITPGTIELVWFGGALITAVGAMVILRRRPEAWRSLAAGAWPLALVALLVSGKAWLGASIRMYDMLLFAGAFGWTAYWWLRKSEGLSAEPSSAALPIAVGSVVVTLAAWQFWEQVRYLNDLALGYADCGENARLMFNTMTNPRELFLRVNPNKSLFYDHFHPGILPFMPLWVLWPDLKLTIALQLVAVFGAVVPLYFIGKHVFRDQTSTWLLVLAWALYPATSQFVYSASYGFRWGNMCLLLYFIALALWVTGHRGGALAMAVWAMSIKEEAALVVGMFGVYLAVFERRRWAGTALCAFAFGYFLLTTTILIPAISGHHYAQTRFFYGLGHTNREILLSPLTKPRIFWGKLFEPSSVYFAAALLGPLLLLPVRRPAVLLIGMPTFIFCCMNPILKNICFHYQAALLPVIFWALVRAVQDWDARRRRDGLAGVGVSCLLFSVFLGAQPWSKDTLVIRRWLGRLALVHRAGEQIDPHGTLFATQRAAAHFVTQRYLYLDPPVPQQTDYALLDLRDSWRGAVPNLGWLQHVRDIQRETEAIPGLHLVSAADGMLLYSRHGDPLDARAVVERARLPDEANRTSADFGNLHVAGFTAIRLPPGEGAPFDHIRATAYSTVTTPTNLDLAMRCLVYVGRDPASVDIYVSEFQPLGQGIWPIARWETNKFYADEFVVPLPAGLAGEISSISFQAATLSPAPSEPAPARNF